MGNSVNDITIDELSEIYRVEKKSRGLSTVRFDLYKAMADYYRRIRKEYDDALRKDPDAVMCEGVNARRKKCYQLSHDIVEMRMRKICQMALRGAVGGTNSLDTLTEEEKDYYENILAISKGHASLLERLSGSIAYTNQDLTTMAPRPVPVPEIPIPVPQAEEPPVEEYYEPEDDIPLPEEEVPAQPAHAEPIKNVGEEASADIPLDVIPEMGEFDMDEEPETDIPDDELDAMGPAEPIMKQDKRNDSEFMLLRIISSEVEEFSGPVRDYSVKERQVVRIPAFLGKVLIAHNYAEEIKYSP